MTIFTYNFSEPANTSVTALSPPWTIRAGDDWQVHTNAAVRKIAGAANNHFASVGLSSTTTQEVKCDFIGTGSLHGIMLFGTISAGLINGYWLRATNSTSLRLLKVVNNVATTLVTTITVPNVLNCRLTVVNLGSSAELKVYHNNILLATHVDNTSPLLSGFAGLYATGTAATGTLDNVEVVDVGAPLLINITINNNLIEDAAPDGTVIDTLVGNAQNSSFSLVSNPGNIVRLEEPVDNTWRLVVNGTYAFNPDNLKPDIVVEETLVGASNSPRQSTIQLQGVPVFVPASTPPAKVYPALSWNGTPGSGGVAPSDITNDPNRGKPGLKVFTNSENRRVTLTRNRKLIIQSFCPGGLRRVDVYCEGRTASETAMRLCTYEGGDGSSRTVWGYEFDFSYPDFPSDGSADFYVFSYPNDLDYDVRRIGPFRIHRYAAEYAVERTVNPAQAASGNNFHTIMAALNATTAAGVYPARITVQQNLTEQLGTVSPSRDLAADTWITVQTAAGVSATLTGPGPGYLDNIDFRCNLLEFHGTFSFDADTFRLLLFNENYPIWFGLHGCTVYRSSRFNLKTYRNSNFLTQPPSTNPKDNNRLITSETTFNEMTGGCAAFRHRNFTLNGSANDTTSNSMHTHNLVVNDSDASGLRFYFTACDIRYDGSSVTADVEKTGGNGSSSSTIILRENSVPVLTITDTEFTNAAQFKALVEAVPGWTVNLAVATGPDLAICFYTQNGTAAFGPFAPINCKATNARIYKGVDLHIDVLAQHSTGGTPDENIVHVNPKGVSIGTDGQGAQLSLNGLRDLYIINPLLDHVGEATTNFNAGKNGGSDIYLNWNIWNPTFPRQTLVIQAGYNENIIKNGLVKSVAATPESYVSSNYDRMVQRSLGTLPPNASNVTIEPTLANIFTDGGAPGSNFIPSETGPLVTNKWYSEVPFDVNNNLRAKLSALGAVRANSEGVVDTPPTFTTQPNVTGTAQVGQLLTLNPGVVDIGSIVSYQWRADGVNIVGATGLTYLLTAAELATNIDCRVLATNGSAQTFANSNLLGPVAAAPVLTPFTKHGRTVALDLTLEL